MRGDNVKETIEFDKYDLGIIINGLNMLRNNQINIQRPTDSIDNLLLRIIPIYEICDAKSKKAKCLTINGNR